MFTDDGGIGGDAKLSYIVSLARARKKGIKTLISCVYQVRARIDGVYNTITREMRTTTSLYTFILYAIFVRQGWRGVKSETFVSYFIPVRLSNFSYHITQDAFSEMISSASYL